MHCKGACILVSLDRNVIPLQHLFTFLFALPLQTCLQVLPLPESNIMQSGARETQHAENAFSHHAQRVLNQLLLNKVKADIASF